ncbi:MAG: adenylate/guanylate cyclase domain-containing protein [Gaiellaceae bacterium]|jgi:class 3 adenylate cyclase/tetratricopeptide (TPR) repeat protein
MALCPSCGQVNPEGFRFCGACGRPLRVDAGAGVRKTVTIVFCDIAGSTALGESMDPEALRAVLARYFERVKGIVELHGGTVEKFIGDAVMAVFGLPFAHEDDALRAVRAALEMQAAMPELGVAARIGVNSGEVVSGTGERLAVGDAVNVAARLEQAARPGEVLIGEETFAFVEGAAVVEHVEPLEIKGKAEPVEALRLLSVRDAPQRGHELPFVGRERELALVRETWRRVCHDRCCELVTIVGEAGIGKSRLVAESLRDIEATPVQGRCLPYGNGITYWPVVEVLKQLRLVPDDARVATAIRSLLGESDARIGSEELAWAVRKTLEQAAGTKPLVVVFDDIHHGEETFLDLIEHVALLSAGEPILLLCMARPELTERRPSWPVGLQLEPLSDEQMEELTKPASLALRPQIVRAAGGNPLFVSEMLALTGAFHVPPTLQALLAARLDQLEPAERRVLESGAVEGETFHRSAVQALAPDQPQLSHHLAALVRMGLIRPDKPQIPGEDAFRFRHLLIRDAAYEALPKAVRADLHERFAGWLGDRGGSLVELDDLLGYHLEQAVRYRDELGVPTDIERRDAARHHLVAAGRTAFAREDHVAAISMLERAVALRPEPPDVGLELELVHALVAGGRYVDALSRADALAKRAGAVGNVVGELGARIKAGGLRVFLEPEGATDELATLLERALPQLEAAGDDGLLCHAYESLGGVWNMRMQYDRAGEAYDRAAAHAARAGLPYSFIGWRSLLRLWGTWPVARWLAWQEEQEDQRDSGLRIDHAHALAMLGRIDEAREELTRVQADLADRGASARQAGIGMKVLILELHGGDPEAALAAGRTSCEALERLGESSALSSLCGLLAQACYQTGRLDEVDGWATRAASLGATDDVLTQILWRLARAKVLARRGSHVDAESLAGEAVALADKTELPDMQGNAYADLAEVLSLAGHFEEARAALEEALDRYERKGEPVMAKRIRERLAALGNRHAVRRPATVGR